LRLNLQATRRLYFLNCRGLGRSCEMRWPNKELKCPTDRRAAIQWDGIQRDAFFIWITEKQACYVVQMLGEKLFCMLWFSQGQPINNGAGVVLC